MDLNKETAMRLWNKTFGNEIKVKDFAGRLIAKGAYNDRNSEFGWNVDHILPQSRGGKTADHNLICCHILTNDEKADKFPCFVANGNKYEIIKVQSHYEIRPLSKKQNSNKKDENPNFLDAGYGIRLYEKLKRIQKQERFVGSILIRFNNLTNTALIDFIEELFDKENITYSIEKGSGDFISMMYGDWEETRIIVKSYNMTSEDEAQVLLDKCVILNTYLVHYFKLKDTFDDFEIRYCINYYENKMKMYKDFQYINFEKINGEFAHDLLINNLVIENTDAKEKVNYSDNDWTHFNYIYTKLSRDLNKEGRK